MKKITPLFIPICGAFGALAGHFLWGGGRYTLLGVGVGLIVGVVFRLYQQFKPK